MSEDVREVDVIESDQVSITAYYSRETLTYYPSQQQPLHLQVQSATTTLGSQIVSDSHDATGIIIWPATHLLCQYCCSHPRLGEYVLELGCGCGLVGIAATKSANPPTLWVSTDINEHALKLCRQNFALNEMVVDEVDSRAWVRTLRWGDDSLGQGILNELQHRSLDNKVTKFDAIVGADIVYPSTCGKVLKDMFITVDTLLKPDGIFWLSFATRDGPRTPAKLLEAANETGFAIDSIPDLDMNVAKFLPPLLDSKILLLRRSFNAREHNRQLGADDCSIFPRLHTTLARLEEPSSEEEWEPPYFDSDLDHAE